MNRGDRGFTLVELLVAMAVGMIVVGAVYAMFTYQSKHLDNQEQLAVIHQNARVAMDMMVREISMAGYNQTTDPATITAVPRCTNTLVAAGTPCVGITDAEATSISFTADLNGNGSITAGSSNPNENIVYDFYSSIGVQTLGRTSNGQRQPMVNYVESLEFLYYDGSGNATTNLANIRRVKVTIRTITANEDPTYTDPTYGDHHRRYTLSAFAFPRNLALSP